MHSRIMKLILDDNTDVKANLPFDKSQLFSKMNDTFAKDTQVCLNLCLSFSLLFYLSHSVCLVTQLSIYLHIFPILSYLFPCIFASFYILVYAHMRDEAKVILRI